MTKTTAYRHIAPIRESLETDRTLVRFLSTANEHVKSIRTPPGDRLVVHHKPVCPQMLLQEHFPRKAFSALSTLVRFDARMSETKHVQDLSNENESKENEIQLTFGRAC